jgi:predicted O-methyltransferase YrrM
MDDITTTERPLARIRRQRIGEPRIADTLTRVHDEAAAHDRTRMHGVGTAAIERGASSEADVADLLAEVYMSVDATNGRLLHLLALSRPVGRIVEFGTSMGISTIYLAAALTDDELPVLATELEAHKVEQARSHLTEAGLDGRVDIVHGDALTTLAGLGDPVSMVFLDGWKGVYLDVLRLLEPCLVPGALVVADDTEHPLLAPQCAGYLAYVRDPANGYLSVRLPIDDGLELSRWNGVIEGA